METELHGTIEQLLRRTRQRYTRGRRDLVELLRELDRPVTIPELLTAGAPQSQSSLYRNLGVLEQAGAVRRLVSLDDVARYELGEHVSEHHHHLVCDVCGRIDDVTLAAGAEQALVAAAEQARDQHGYEVGSHRVELVGVCPDCA